MDAKEIRHKAAMVLGSGGTDGLPATGLESAFFLAEIAAQLAELNSNLRVHSAIAAGEGNPQ